MLVFLRNFTDYQPANLVYTLFIKNGATQQQQEIKRSEPGTTASNTIGKITDVRVVRYDILVTSRTEQAAQHQT